MPLMRRFWPYLILALAPLLALWPAVLGGKAIGPFDHIRQMAPWNAPPVKEPFDVLQADGVLQFHQWRDLVFDGWSRMEPPFWNPYVLAGTPLMANSQSGALYPPHVLAGVLRIPTPIAITLLAWLHLAWAGLGTYALCRRLGANRAGGVIAGVSFSLSAFLVSWTGLPSVITTVAWIPWVLALVVGLFAEGPRLRPMGLLALCVAMMILAGHLQFVAYGFVAAVVVSLWLLVAGWRASRSQSLSAAANVVLGLLLGALISLPQLLPVLSYSQFSHRRNSPSAEGYAAYQSGAIQPFEFVGFVHSSLAGNPKAYVPGIDAEMPSYWPAYAKRGANFAEGAVAIGPLILALLFLLRRRNDWRRLGSMAALAGVAFLLAMGTALGRLPYFVIPGWSATGSPGRIAVLFILALCVLAGVAMANEAELEEQESKNKGKWLPYLPVLALALATVLSFAGLSLASGSLAPWISGVDQEGLAEIISRSTAMPKAMASLSTLLVALLVFFWIKNRHKPTWALFVALLVSLGLSSGNALRFSSSSDLSVKLPPGIGSHERIAAINDPWHLLVPAPAVMPPNTGIATRLHDLGGYDSLVHRDTVKLLADIDGGDPAPPANGNMMFIKPGAQREKLAAAGVTRLMTAHDHDVHIDPIEGPGRVSSDAGVARIDRETLNTVTVTAAGPGRLVLRDRNMPGWSVTVNGKVAELRGDLWREVDLPDGESLVVFKYVPPGFASGLAVSGVALLATLLLAGVFGARRPRKIRSEPSQIEPDRPQY